jgi:long-chain fatty acid transport protein
MELVKKFVLVTSLLGSQLVLSSAALATNGYFTHGLGVKNKSLAGAGTASPDEAIASANNPAAAVLLDTSLEVGLSLFSPRRSFDVSTSAAQGNGGAFTLDSGVDSGRNFFPVPYLAWNWRRSDDNALALAIYGRGGMNTEYTSGSATFDPDGPGPAPIISAPGVFGGGEMGVNFSQLFMEASYARQAGSLAWGVSLVVAAQALEINGLSAFAPYTRTFAASGGTQAPTNLTNRDHDLVFGAGYKLGGIWTATDTLRLALSYQSEIGMSEFDEYRDLFADAGSFDVPESIKAGVSWDSTSWLTLHVDVEQTNFSKIGSIGNSSTVLFSCPTAGAGGTNVEACLGGSEGAGFGWDDMTTYKFGMTYRPVSLPGWVFRGGFSHGNQPVQSADVLLNIIAPAVVEKHFTLGATTNVGSRLLSMALMYAPTQTVNGINLFDPTQSVALKMRQYELEFSLAF